MIAFLKDLDPKRGAQVDRPLSAAIGRAMEQADMGVDPLDDLAIQFQDQPENAVRGRMLGTEVERVVADLGVVEARGAAVDERHRGGGVGHHFTSPRWAASPTAVW